MRRGRAPRPGAAAMIAAALVVGACLAGSLAGLVLPDGARGAVGVRAELEAPGAAARPPQALVAAGEPWRGDAGKADAARAAPRAREGESARPAPSALASVVEGRVVTSDGRPAAGLVVRWVGDGDEPVRGTCAPDGGFRLDGAPPGGGSLWLGEGEETFLEPLPLVVTPPHTAVGEIELPPLGELDVRVVDEAGLVVPDARVRVTAHPRGVRTLATDADGKASAALLPAGELRVYASHPRYGRTNRPLALAAGEEAGVELRLVRRE